MVILVIAACQSEEPIEKPYDVQISYATYQLDKPRFVLPLDNESSVDSYAPSGYLAQDRYFFYNKNNKSIYTYQLQDTLFKLEHITKVPLDPSVNFRRVAEVHYHNKDSIFIYDDLNFQGDQPDLYLINVEGQIINSYKLTNVSEGDVMKLDRLNTITGPTMYYHEGKIYMATSLSKQTAKENWKPLLIYDLATGEKQLRGEFPLLPTTAIYAQYTYSFQFVLAPDREEIYFSFAYESDLYRYSLVNDTWEEIKFEADEFSKPEEREANDSMRAYVESNAWFYGIFYDQSTSRLHRILYLPSTEFSPTTSASDVVEGLVLTADEQRMVLHRIDPDNGNYDVVPKFSHFRTMLFHPKLGPLVQTQLNDAYELDSEDYLILAPVIIQ